MKTIIVIAVMTFFFVCVVMLALCYAASSDEDYLE